MIKHTKYTNIKIQYSAQKKVSAWDGSVFFHGLIKVIGKDKEGNQGITYIKRTYVNYVTPSKAKDDALELAKQVKKNYHVSLHPRIEIEEVA